MTVPNPSLNQAYNMIMQYESQRVQPNMISASILPIQQLNISDSIALASIQLNKFKKSEELYCEHCHLRNHTIKSCYKLIGYPADHKYGKKNAMDKDDRRSHYEKDKKRFGVDRTHRFAGNRKQQVNNAYTKDETQQSGQYNANHLERNLDIGNSSSILMLVPTFTPDQYQHIMKL